MSLDRMAKRMESAKKAYENRKARLRENYQYAKSLGFSPAEAQALSFMGREAIDELAAKRKQERK